MPGQRVEMIILFQRETIVESFDSRSQASTSNQAACPRCQVDVLDPRDAETQWYICLCPTISLQANTPIVTRVVSVSAALLRLRRSILSLRLPHQSLG